MVVKRPFGVGEVKILGSESNRSQSSLFVKMTTANTVMLLANVPFIYFMDLSWNSFLKHVHQPSNLLIKSKIFKLHYLLSGNQASQEPYGPGFEYSLFCISIWQADDCMSPFMFPWPGENCHSSPQPCRNQFLLDELSQNLNQQWWTWLWSGFHF